MILSNPLSISALPPLVTSPPMIPIVGMATRHEIPRVRDSASRSPSDHYPLARLPLTTNEPAQPLDMPAKQTGERKDRSIQPLKVERTRLESGKLHGRSSQSLSPVYAHCKRIIPPLPTMDAFCSSILRHAFVVQL